MELSIWRDVDCYNRIAKHSTTQAQPFQVRKTHKRYSQFYLFRVNKELVKWECQEGHTGEGNSSLCDNTVKKSSCAKQLLSRESYLGKTTNSNPTPLHKGVSEFRNPIKPSLVDTHNTALETEIKIGTVIAKCI